MKKNEIMPFATTWMNLKIIILSEMSGRERKYIMSLIYGIFKNNTNHFIYKTEIDSQTQKTNLQLPKGNMIGEG